MKIKELLNKGIEELTKGKVEDNNIKARILLEYVLDEDKKYILINSEQEVSKEKEIEYIKRIDEMIVGKPLQYITNKQEFMGNEFFVNENVLIPQPDTEVVVEEVLKYINVIRNKGKSEIKVLDLCTGSGAIAVSIAKHTKGDVIVYASDISEDALEIAKKNAIKNEVKVQYILSNMFEKIEGMKFDIIVSNPPYIESRVIEKLSKEVQSEPHIALDGGEDGLNFYRIICEQADEYLKADGRLFLEIGYDQKEKVLELFKNKEIYDSIVTKKDFGGNDRVIIIKKK